MATAIEAMGANLALWQANGLHNIIHCVELQGIEPKFLSHDLYHLVILRGIGSGILVELGIWVALHILDDATSKQLQITFGSCVAHKRTRVDEWRTADADVHLLGAIFACGLATYCG